jgi:RNA polymerase sigma-70 factor (ECF subfamily)
MNNIKTKELLEKKLLPHREKLLNFIQSKVSDPDLAEDILQDSLLKAIRGLPDLDKDDKILSWFYQIVRNRIVDHYRRSGTESKKMKEYAREISLFYDSGDEEKTVCQCFRGILSEIKPEYSVLIKEMELGDELPEQVAERLGITRNNLKVRRYRARQKLQDKLVETCGKCAERGCTDCECE